ncbi:MAG: hypothetical protein HQK86_01865, partial [Nitrospinae bacterium]|nr:hypothetical protein [Nitrospinota bacterium]
MEILTRRSSASIASVIIISCLAAFTIRVSSAQQAVQPASAFSGAVWVAESLGLVKLSATDGSFVFKIAGSGEARALALDGKRGRAWVYLKGELRAYGFDGSLLVTALPPRSHSGERDGGDDDDDENGRPAIGVVAQTGAVWLAVEKRLYQFDFSGAPVFQVSLPDNAVAISMDEATGTAWVFSKKSAVAYAVSGVPTGQIVFGKKAEVSDGCYDPESSSVWVAAKDAVRKYSAGGALLAERKIKKARRVTASLLGGVWVAADGEIYLLDQSAGVVLSERVGGHEAKAGAMAVNPADLSLWASLGRNLVHIAPSGQVAHYLEIEGKIRALAVYADAEPPVIKFTAPLGGSVTNLQSPSVELEYSDVGSGVDINTLSIKYNGQPFAGTCQSTADKAVCSPSAPIAEGMAAFEATISDNAGNVAGKASLDFSIDATAPTITLASPSDGTLTQLASATVAGSVSELSDVSVTITSAAGVVTNHVTLGADLSFAFGAVTLSEGANTFVISATDPAGNMGASRAVVTLDTTPPAPVVAGSVVISNPVNGQVTVSGSAGAAEAMATVKITNLRTGQVVNVQAGADGGFTASIAAKAADQLTISLADSLGNESSQTSFVTPGTLFTAPPLDPSAPTNIADAVAFLYTGPDAIQTGVAAGAIDSRFVAVLRGKVSGADGQPLAGVVITINGRPEYGQSATRDDGMFDLAVNGGSRIAVNYSKDGYLPVQRMIDAPWRDYAWAPDVTMIQFDPMVTTVDLTAPATQVAQGSVITDQDGSRQATMVFNPGTTATITLPDGSIQQLTSLNVRATEYTVGPNGPSAMPGELPPASAYTYAVEYSVDEAIAQNAKEVNFNQPVPLYVDNFLNFPVGDGVPLGFFNREQSAWIASDDAFVIKILSVTGGLADIDLDGAGVPATPAKLASLYITDSERQKLATMYQPGKTLWRGFTTHFSPVDWNKALFLPGDSVPPGDGPRQNPDPNCPCPP